MRAALFHGQGMPLTIEDVEVPQIGHGEVLVKTAACGVCATDLHYMHGTPTFKAPPLILGHEVSGVVDKVSTDVTRLAVGDRVIIPAVLSCGECRSCMEGRDNICEKMTMLGNHVDGGFAEYLKVTARAPFKIPEGLPTVESAIISDAVSTPFHAIKNRGQVSAGDYVAIFGCGGVGINAVQIAAAFGGTVIAVDVDDNKLALAKQMGAAVTLDSKDANVAKKIREITQGGVDVAFELVGKPEVLELAFNSVRTGGKLVSVGYSEQSWNLRMNRVMFREISILGSLGSRLAEYPRIIEMARQGRLKLSPVISKRLPLESINEALGNLESGIVVGRQVVVF